MILVVILSVFTLVLLAVTMYMVTRFGNKEYIESYNLTIHTPQSTASKGVQEFVLLGAQLSHMFIQEENDTFSNGFIRSYTSSDVRSLTESRRKVMLYGNSDTVGQSITDSDIHVGDVIIDSSLTANITSPYNLRCTFSYVEYYNDTTRLRVYINGYPTGTKSFFRQGNPAEFFVDMTTVGKPEAIRFYDESKPMLNVLTQPWRIEHWGNAPSQATLDLMSNGKDNHIGIPVKMPLTFLGQDVNIARLFAEYTLGSERNPYVNQNWGENYDENSDVWQVVSARVAPLALKLVHTTRANS